MSDVKPIPEGYPRVTPYLHVDGADAALGFYKDILEAEERMRMPGPDGKLGHAELESAVPPSPSMSTSRTWTPCSRPPLAPARPGFSRSRTGSTVTA